MTSSETLFQPTGIAVDSGGTMYVLSNTLAAKFDSTGEFVKFISSGGATSGITVDPTNDDVYIDEKNRIVQLDSAGNPTGGSDGLGGPVGVGNLSSANALAVASGRLYVSNKGGASVAVFGPALKATRLIDNPLVLDAVGAAGIRHTEDFQVNPSGIAVFSTGMQLAGNPDDSGKYQIYRYDPAGQSPVCVSCIPTEARPTTDTFPSAYGLSLTDDGRVFFTSAEPLALRDSNERRDAYEWEGGNLQLISTGTSESDATLLSASSDGTNAFFFTRQQLVPSDQNGSLVRLYTARENGGFPFGPPEFQCAASDECHGPGSQAAPPASVGTSAGTSHQFQPTPATCRKGKVKRHGRCVAVNHKKPRHHKKPHHKKTTRVKQGGRK